MVNVFLTLFVLNLLCNNPRELSWKADRDSWKSRLISGRANSSWTGRCWDCHQWKGSNFPAHHNFHR